MARSIEMRYGLAFGSSWPLDTLGRRAPHCGGEIDAMGRPGVDIITNDVDIISDGPLMAYGGRSGTELTGWLPSVGSLHL
jgi:hypothetical protein